MSLKVDMSEVVALSNKITKGQNKAETSLNSVKSEIGSLSGMESFQGQAADIAKYYFSELHESIIQGFQLLLIELNSNSDENVKDFLSSVDKSKSAKIVQSYVEERKEKIESTYSSLESVSQDVHQTIESVSDLVSIIKPSFYEITSRKNVLTRIMENLVEDMGNFSNSANSEELREMLNNIRVLMSNAQAKTGEDRYVEFYKGDSKKAKEELDKWIDRNREKLPLEIASAAGSKLAIFFKSTSRANMTAQATALYYILRDMGKEQRKQFLRTGNHSLFKSSYIRYNNLLTMTDIFRMRGKDLMNVAKDIIKNRRNPLEALKSTPHSNVRGKLAMQKEFDRLLDLKRYQDFQKLTKTSEMYKSFFKTFGNELVGNNFKAAKNIISKTNWKKPQTLLTGTVDEVKKQTKGLNILGKVGKLAGPLSAGLHIADNFTEHKGDTQKAIVGSAVDIAGTSVAAASGAAVGSLFLPPIGTVIGFGVGTLVGAGLNKKLGKPPKSVLDHTKDGVNKAINKIAGWFK